jgi:pimeloyl-ACP methyl ester carboxylesterase
VNRWTRQSARAVVAAVAATATVLAGCTAWSGGGEETTRRAPVQGAQLVPEACIDEANWDAVDLAPERRDRLDVQCSTLTVPLDHTHPEKGTLKMAVVRVRAAGQHDRIGSLVLNPGGPGVSGLDQMPSWASWLPDDLLARFDLVSFDPRGTGASSPIRCADPSGDLADAPLPDLLTDAGFVAATKLVRARATACSDALGALGGSFGTDAVARDLDMLRGALGDRRLTYVGWSYGARLGAHYAHLFPGRVRALILDGPPNPVAPWLEVFGAQLAGFEHALDSYAEGCRVRESCAVVTGGARGALVRVVTMARTRPIPSGRPQGDPPATWDLVLRAVLGFLAAPELWPALDAALAEADRGDSGSLYDMIDSLEGKTPAHPDTDSDDVMQVVLCTDTPATGSTADVRGHAARLARVHPTFGEFGAWWLFQCTAWTASRAPLPAPSTTTTVPLLVIGTTADPSTPFGGAQAFVGALGPRAVLLSAAGDGHTAFGRSGCVGEHAVRYLVDVDPPPPGTTCA